MKQIENSSVKILELVKKREIDYCYAFLEKGVDLLASGGKMVQLIPSNIYKNVFADDIRKNFFLASAPYGNIPIVNYLKIRLHQAAFWFMKAEII